MKRNIMFLIIGIILASSITAYATIKLQASEIDYNDTTLDKVLDDLYSKTNVLNLLDFSGSYINANYRIEPNNYVSIENDSMWLHSTSTIDYNFSSDDNYEVSLDLYYNDSSAELMGGIYLYLYYQDNIVALISIIDAYGANLKTQIYTSLKDTVLYNNLVEVSDCSGKYSIVKNNNNLYFYKNNSLLATVSSNENIQIDKIKLDFRKYPGRNTPSMYIKNIYVGPSINK